MAHMLINGVSTEFLPASDRGLLYGDGVFTTVAVRAGRAELWERHSTRLRETCRRLGLPEPDEARLVEERERLITGCERGVLRITLTRGVGGRGYRYEPDMAATRVLALHPWPDHSAVPVETGVTVRLCDTRLAVQPALAGLKTLNRLEQVLARAEWRESDVHEGVMQDTEGRVVEATMSNLFLVHEGRLLTPDLTRCGIAGVMRAELLALAADEQIAVEVREIGLPELMTADEVFLCNSLIRIWPVAKLASRELLPGPMTARLRQALNRRLS